MTLIISEKEMIERYSDSLKEAASRCRELIKSDEKDRPEVFIKLAHSLKICAGSAHQLAISQENTKFLQIRDAIERFLEFSQQNIFKKHEGHVWTVVANQLDILADNGKKVATSKAMTRLQVLTELDSRERKARLDV